MYVNAFTLTNQNSLCPQSNGWHDEETGGVSGGGGGGTTETGVDKG